jgi:hypothetical protein
MRTLINTYGRAGLVPLNCAMLAAVIVMAAL